MKNIKPELLSPAGSMESLRAALAAGADAVYFGGTAFSNRMRAKNFDEDTIREAIKLCHSVGAKAYITVNTRVRDREMDDLFRFAEEILTGEACDALIMADFGAAYEIKRRFPHVCLHASTQTSMSSPSDCEALSDIGFSRLVVPRELSFGEIRTLAESTDTELEMFIHGAHCVSLSGQCLLSAVMGGRSGNRGECAQPCRLPYNMGAKGGEEYPLSLADMCLAGRMRDVIASGVASLKIEGRLKTDGYVYGVTKIYRTLLDEERNATKDEINALASLFTRGFTDGYFTEKYATMSGRKNSGSADVKAGIVNAGIETRVKKTAADSAVPISARFTLRAGEPAELTLSSGAVSVTERGEIASAATGKPLDREAVARSLTKLGGTGFSLSDNKIETNIDDGLWMSASQINDLRRRAAAALTEAVSAAGADARTPVDEFPIKIDIPAVPASVERGVKVALLEHADAAGKYDIDEFSRVYAQIWDFDVLAKKVPQGKLCAILPALEPSDNVLSADLMKLYANGCRRVMCHTAGQVYLAKSLGFVCDMSMRANVTNAAAYRYYKAIGCETVTLSPELPDGAVRSLGGGAVVYGRLPLMHLSRCLGLKKCAGSDKKCALGRRRGESLLGGRDICHGELIDRKGVSFPVRGLPDCVNVIYNSVVTDKTARLRELDGAECFVYYLM